VSPNCSAPQNRYCRTVTHSLTPSLTSLTSSLNTPTQCSLTSTFIVSRHSLACHAFTHSHQLLHYTTCSLTPCSLTPTANITPPAHFHLHSLTPGWARIVSAPTRNVGRSHGRANRRVYPPRRWDGRKPPPRHRDGSPSPHEEAREGECNRQLTCPCMRACLRACVRACASHPLLYSYNTLFCICVYSSSTGVVLSLR
jgi:hypothetical protein